MPYFVGVTTFLAHKDLNGQRPADLAGGTVCLAGGTSTEQLVSDYIAQNKIDVKLVTFEENEEALAAYAANRCDAYPGTRGGDHCSLHRRAADCRRGCLSAARGDFGDG